MNKLIECRNINFHYNDYKNHKNEILKNTELVINSSESIAILGNSGCGKSTLLNIIAGFNSPTKGDIFIKNKNIYAMNEKSRTKLRLETLGFVYQTHNLLKDFNVIDNVVMPLLIKGENIKTATKKATKILKRIELGNKIYNKIGELSGGERQKVSLARAIINKPECVIADEPTGNLDEKSSALVLSLLLELIKEYNTSLLVVTHDNFIAKEMDKTAILEKKKLKFI